ncbi:MAG TPA: biotin--[acetyl-CoA-carboxylase] ligase [Gammaproteobacteria bacterium]|nr:biotin--[acetyl-CoA-carboxylase] ligase [Gammaproteobacteria bacterium]
MPLRHLLKQMPIAEWIMAADLAQRTNLDQRTLDHHVHALIKDGVAIGCCKRRGYYLFEAVDFVDQGELINMLKASPLLRSGRLEVLDEVDSTNTRLLTWPELSGFHGRACVTEFQTAGRGRHGKRWHGARYRNIMLSLAWQWRRSSDLVTGLSLSIGLAVARVLSQWAGPGLQLKWPNDIMFSEGKLAGILVDVIPAGDGPLRVVVGIGVNICNSLDLEQVVDQRVINLQDIAIRSISRTQLTGELILAMALALDRFEKSGFAPDQVAWNQCDRFRGRTVLASIGGQVFEGAGYGVDSEGCYRIIDTSGNEQAVSTGEVKLSANPNRRFR